MASESDRTQLRLTLNRALEIFNFPLLERSDQWKRIGSGAWHDAYLISIQRNDPMVVRLRKRRIYGREEIWSPEELHSDYAPAGMYYREANRCLPGICPTVYDYHIEPGFPFTFESFVPGVPLPLSKLSNHQATALGVRIGEFFKAMHEQLAPISGTGEMKWESGNVCCDGARNLGDHWTTLETRIYEQTVELGAESSIPEGIYLEEKAADALGALKDRGETVSLVNGDVTPENLLMRDLDWIGLVDPVPIQGSGLYYASFFLHCYRLSLPALSQAPRYREHRFDKHADVLASLADGYGTAYSDGDTNILTLLRMAEWLWALEFAWECDSLLKSKLDIESRLRRRNKRAIRSAFKMAVDRLKEIHW